MFLGVTPHHQYLAPTRYGRKHFAKKDGFNRYLNAIRYDDFWTKNIIETYKDLGLYEDTIFVIYGDHGEGFGEHGRFQHDGVIWEEGLRVPLIFHDPQSFDGGARVEGPPAHLLDFAPTIVDMLGYEVVDGAYPGRSMLNLPEDRTLHFGCRPDLLRTARIQDQEKYVYHFLRPRQGPPRTEQPRRSPWRQGAAPAALRVARVARRNHRCLRPAEPLIDAP